MKTGDDNEDYFDFPFSARQQHHAIKRDTPEDKLSVVGFRIEKAEKEPQIDDGVPVLRADTNVELRLFGSGFTNTTRIGLTTESLDFGVTCNMMISTGYFHIVLESATNAIVAVKLPKNSFELFICATNDDVSERCTFKCLVIKRSELFFFFRSCM